MPLQELLGCRWGWQLVESLRQSSVYFVVTSFSTRATAPRTFRDRTRKVTLPLRTSEAPEELLHCAWNVRVESHGAKATGTLLCLSPQPRMWRAERLTPGSHRHWLVTDTCCNSLRCYVWTSLSFSTRGKNAWEIQLLLNYNPITHFIHHLMLFDYLNLISFYNSKCLHEKIKLPWSPSVRRPFHGNALQWCSLGSSSGPCGSSLRSLIEKTWSKPLIPSPFGLYPCCLSSLPLLLYSCFRRN